jgi:hypothetical protein
MTPNRRVTWQSYIGRRKFLATLGGAAAVWPLVARAQQAGKTPRVGYIRAGNPNNDPFRPGRCV